MINISEKIKETFSEREWLMYRALEIVGRMLRENPMGDISVYPPEIMGIVVGGEKRDPNGKEYIDYFLNCATRELLKEGIL